ncbi:hypothetical protein AN641_07375 [Candidatus Epulonipiscioides gigas]|nr:hypothetical protein AN641_07375 [Epulopiscium sp. SCG-C07WGA-EpuloA2]
MAFSDCNSLKEIIIPTSVISIGVGVFDNIEKIYYSGSKEQWYNLDMDVSENTIIIYNHN